MDYEFEKKNQQEKKTVTVHLTLADYELLQQICYREECGASAFFRGLFRAYKRAKGE